MDQEQLAVIVRGTDRPNMFDVSFSEILMIMVVALLVFGPDRLPEMARKVGKIMGQLRRHSNDLRREFYNTVYTPAEDLKRDLDLSSRELRVLKNDLVQDFRDITKLDTPVADPKASSPTTPPTPPTPSLESKSDGSDKQS